VISGSTGPLTIGAGTTCITNATIGGSLTFGDQARVSIYNSTICGAVTTTGAPQTLLFCGSQLNNGAALTGVSGLLVVGDPANGCATNNITGNVMLTTNHGGFRLVANRVSGSVVVRGNDGGANVVGGNSIGGRLDCTSDTPAASNGGQSNTAMAKTGECAGAAF
jgi:hypothetical protein